MMRLERLILWGPKEHAPRELNFEHGALNIITGWSETGKTAIAPILEFCLGRTHFGVFKGVIRDTVRWYGCVVQIGEERLLLARPAPPPSQKTSSQAMIEILGSDGLPDVEELAPNIDADALQEELSRRIGIDQNLHVPGTGETRRPLEANISHALFLCIQRQNEIANQEILFHRQGSEDFIGQAIRDTLPYFLGAVDRDALGMRRERRRKKTELRQAEADLRNRERAAYDGQAPGRNLLEEARALEMVEPGPHADLWDTLQGALTATVEAKPFEAEDELQGLLVKRQSLAIEERKLREQLELIGSLARERGSFQTEAGEQVARLKSLQLFGDEGSALCPVCGADHQATLPGGEQLIASTERLSADLGVLQAAQPRLEELRDETTTQAEKLKTQLREVSTSINDLLQAQGAAEELTDQLQRQSFVKGRISQYLGSSPKPDEVAIEKARQLVTRLEGDINRLNDRLSNDQTMTRVQSCLNLIGNDMTEWAQRLDLGHSGGGVRIDLTALNVVADEADGAVPLSQIGSAKNWVGYHIVAHLALHKWFVEKDRPVPRFIIFDQPTQAFYPQDQQTSQDPDALEDEDRLAVRAMFKLMNDVAEDLSPGLQVIVTDHANLQEKWFQDAVIEDWHSGDALIPQAWLKGKASSR